MVRIMSPPRQIRISPSRLKTLTDCSLRFYYAEIDRIPEGQSHIKTRVGTLIHLLFEMLMHPRRTPIFRAALEKGFHVREHPSIVRFIHWYCHREVIHPYDIDEIGAMIDVAFLGIAPYFTSPDPPIAHFNERRFQLSLGEHATIAGVIDLLLIWKDRAVVVDLKSQGTKFPRASLASNIQAMVYQLSVHQQFGFIPTVDFIMVRHPPGPRAKDKHIQRVEPPSLDILQGLSVYLQDMYQVVNDFGFEEALSHPCDDGHYCQNFCPYLKPSTYYAVQKDGVTIKSWLDIPEEHEYSGETLVKLRHGGCFAKWPQG